MGKKIIENCHIDGCWIQRKQATVYLAQSILRHRVSLHEASKAKEQVEQTDFGISFLSFICNFQ